MPGRRNAGGGPGGVSVLLYPDSLSHFLDMRQNDIWFVDGEETMTGDVAVPLFIFIAVLSGGFLRWLHRVLPTWLPSALYFVIMGALLRFAFTKTSAPSLIEATLVLLIPYGVFVMGFLLWTKIGPYVSYPFLVVKGVWIAAKRKTDSFAQMAKGDVSK